MPNRQDLVTLMYAMLGILAVAIYGGEMLWLSLAAYYIVWVILTPCWWHLGLWHWGLIRPHSIVNNIHIFLYCAFFPFAPSGPMKIHLRHHDLVNTMSDRNTFKVNQGRIKHLLNQTTPPLRNRPTRNVHPLPDFPFWNWCEKHHLKIFVAVQLIGLVFFTKLFIFCQAIPYLLGRLELPVKIHDIVFHYKPEKNFKPQPWIFPILFSDAWHTDHHKDPVVLNFGPGIFKWINPQWWYFCLIDSNIRKKTFNLRTHTIIHNKD